jgi:hypothetical protein
MEALLKSVRGLSTVDRYVLVSTLALPAIAAVLAAFGLASIGFFYLVATSAVVLAPIARRAFGRSFDLLEPIVLFSFTYFVLFVVRPAYILAEHVTEYSINYAPIDFTPKFTAMQFVALLGAIGAVLSYELVVKWNLGGRKSPKLAGEQGFWLGMAGLATSAVGVLGSLVFVSSIPGGFATILNGRTTTYQDATFDISAYVYYAPMLLIPGSLLLLAAWLSTRKFPYLIASFAAAALLVAVRGPVGGRLALVPLFLGAIVLIYLYRDRRPRAVTFLVVFAIGILGWSLIAQLRNNSVRENKDVGSLVVDSVKSPLSAFEPFTEGHDAAMAPLLAAAMTVIPDKLSYGYGSKLAVDFATRGVPRSLWPDKPLSSKEELTRALWPEQFANKSANPEFSVLAVFYRELGAIGVLIGMIVLGGGLAIAGNYWRSRQGVLLISVGYAIFYANIPMIVRDSPVDSLTRLVFTLGPLVLTGVLLAHFKFKPGLSLEKSPEQGSPTTEH